jgi:hypothetical protein
MKISFCRRNNRQKVVMTSLNKAWLRHILFNAEATLYLHILDLLKASRTNVLAAELNYILTLAAEDAGVGILLEDDRALVGEDFKGILLLDVH